MNDVREHINIIGLYNDNVERVLVSAEWMHHHVALQTTNPFNFTINQVNDELLFDILLLTAVPSIMPRYYANNILRLSDNRKVTDKSCEHIAKINRFSSIHIDRSGITIEGLKTLLTSSDLFHITYKAADRLDDPKYMKSHPNDMDIRSGVVTPDEKELLEANNFRSDPMIHACTWTRQVDYRLWESMRK